MGNGLLWVIQQKPLVDRHISTMWIRTIIIAIFVLAHHLETSNANDGIVKRDADGDGDDSDPNTLDAKILKKLQKFKEIIPIGYPPAGIPILDPYFISNSSFKYHNKIISINCLVENITLSGLKNFKVDKLTVRILPTQIDFNFTLPNTILKIGRYTIKGKLLKFIPIIGSGIVVAKLRDFHVQGYARLSLRDKFLKLTKVYLKGNFGKFDFTITGLLKSQIVSKITSIIVTKVVPIVFREHEKVIWNAIATYAQEIINGMIQHTTFSEAIDILDNDDEFLPPIKSYNATDT